MKPHHIEAKRADRWTAACRAAGIEPALGLAADLLPLNRGVLLLVGNTREGRVFWCERAGLALDARQQPPLVEPVAAFRAQLGLLRQPVALDRYGITAIWAEEDARAARAALMRLLQ
jgi:hypothetical protein